MQVPSKLAGWENGRASAEGLSFSAPGGPQLSGYLVRPSFSAASGAGRHGVVLVHGFPEPGHETGSPSYGYPQLATRLAAETGSMVLTFDLRGTGESAGDFSLTGWQADLASATGALREIPGVEKIWLVGFAAGATLAICAAGDDTALAGVAAFAPPAEFAERASDPRKLLAEARSMGVIHARDFPEDPSAWARELREIEPLRLVAQIPPRPLLIVHGANDDVVPMTAARELADAANSTAELRILPAAGHMLLHDPRAIALLLGWFDRHLGGAG
ncbi:MAG TPA: alpha/beta fold hydrolase [Acidimicrobiales bacterium]|nr:alpha/beta fold hydrolase [Acidimicrobiales bacterium]